MKKLLLSIIALFTLLTASGETVSQKEAMRLAQLFFNEASGRVTPPPKLVYNGRRLTTGRLFTPFYVYNTPIGGFVIISAENKAYPILGFSLKDSFDPDVLGESEKALLTSYAKEIEYIRYDGQPVEDAVNAWIHYDEYVAGILKTAYRATDPKITITEAEKALEIAIEKDDASYSDIYTPQQWRDNVLQELNAKESVAIGIINGNNLYPAVVYGHQGDYFRIEMSQRNSWLMRLNATDIVQSNMIAVTPDAPVLDNDDVEEPNPFDAHDEFLAEILETERQRNAKPSVDISILEQTPILIPNGGGHFEVVAPESITSSTVFNLYGRMVSRRTFADTQRVNIDISSQPSGFYFLTLTGESGKLYGLKLHR